MKRKADKYRDYVEHPRYGRGPIFTGLNPRPNMPDIYFGVSAALEQLVENFDITTLPVGFQRDFFEQSRRIANTAIVANQEKQIPATFQVTHYFDLERACCDCKRFFIFFAQEQKFWYEELGFGLDSQCVRCVDCRKAEQEMARLRKQYEHLLKKETRTEKESLQMAECCATLIIDGVFTPKKWDMVRMLLNTVSTDSPLRQESRYEKLWKLSHPEHDA
jgi:hypothetical protein